ncbi:tetratricopeptide repeat protein [Acetobacter fabarum]|uniref:tetratricopeptide repeat protein n=1 Tax=Acetobacter fabarum TaxID=483199 RepID=UPI00312B603E
MRCPSTTPDTELTTLRHAMQALQAGQFSQPRSLLAPLVAQQNEQALILHAFCLCGEGDTLAAARILTTIGLRNPDSQHPIQDLSELMVALDQRNAAIAVCRAAIQSAPADIRIHTVLGDLLVQTGQFEAAIATLTKVTTRHPQNMLAHNLLSMAHTESGALDTALQCLTACLHHTPNDVPTLANIGSVLAAQGQMEQSFAYFAQALALRPQDARIRVNHSVARLKAGRYAQGWREHEWRFQLPGHPSPPMERLLPTLGSNTDLSGQRVLITHEEGLGDTLMFARYVRPLAERGAILHLWVPEALADLCRNIEGVHTVQVGGTTPTYDWYCPFISLPRVFAATSHPWGAPVPYLRANSQKVAALATLLPMNGKLNVGLVWGGAPRPTSYVAHMIDRRRSMSLHTMAPLGAVQGINLISLQKGPYAEQMMDPPEGMALYDPTDSLHTMDDTAALIMGLDVVVTVDTSVVHLAGALGKPVLLMDRYDNCWRWLHGREDTPWYPTLRIIRQTTPRQWGDVIARVAQILAGMAALPSNPTVDGSLAGRSGFCLHRG